MLYGLQFTPHVPVMRPRFQSAENEVWKPLAETIFSRENIGSLKGKTIKVIYGDGSEWCFTITNIQTSGNVYWRTLPAGTAGSAAYMKFLSLLKETKGLTSNRYFVKQEGNKSQ